MSVWLASGRVQGKLRSEQQRRDGVWRLVGWGPEVPNTGLQPKSRRFPPPTPTPLSRHTLPGVNHEIEGFRRSIS